MNRTRQADIPRPSAMVGVPSRNRCQTCRRKKIKCDGVRPRCGPCRRSATTCEGLDPFVNRTLATQGSSSGGTLTGSSRPPSSRPRTEGQIALYSPLHSHSWAHDSLVAEFVENCIPGIGSRKCTLTWLRDTMVRMKDSDAIHLALSALATGWAGRVESRPDLVNVGLQMYGAAAHRFGREISQSQPAQTLVTTSVLIMYELFEFGAGGDSCWTYHLSGAAAAMSALDLEDRSVSPYSDIMSLFQAIFMVYAFQARKTPLAVPLTIPIPVRSTPRAGFLGLVDLGIETARLLKEADAIEERGQPPLPILMRLNEQLRKISEWEEMCGMTLQTGPIPQQDSPVETGTGEAEDSPSTGLRAFPRRASDSDIGLYDALHDIRVMRIYWTIKLNILRTILGNRYLRGQLQDAEFRLDGAWWEQTPILALVQEADEVARNIHCHFDSTSRSLWPSFGDMLEIWSLETALNWYENHAPEFADVHVITTNQLFSRLQPGLEHCRTLLMENSLHMGYA